MSHGKRDQVAALRAENELLTDKLRLAEARIERLDSNCARVMAANVRLREIVDDAYRMMCPDCAAGVPFCPPAEPSHPKRRFQEIHRHPDGVRQCKAFGLTRALYGALERGQEPPVFAVDPQPVLEILSASYRWRSLIRAWHSNDTSLSVAAYEQAEASLIEAIDALLPEPADRRPARMVSLQPEPKRAVGGR